MNNKIKINQFAKDLDVDAKVLLKCAKDLGIAAKSLKIIKINATAKTFLRRSGI